VLIFCLISKQENWLYERYPHHLQLATNLNSNHNHIIIADKLDSEIRKN